MDQEKLFHKKNIFLKTYFQKDLWLLLLLGISSGVPFLLILSTFSYWLNELSFSKTQVSFFTMMSLPYSLKMFWAPYLEKYKPPFFSKKIGHKKGWGLLAQVFLFASIILMGFIKPDQQPVFSLCAGVMICFFSATQDIVIDGLRIERFCERTNGVAASFSGIGFHLGKLASGCGTLYLADCYGWHTAYECMALSIIPGILAMYFFSLKEGFEQNKSSDISSPLKKSFLSLLEYQNIYFIIAFIILFKIGDAVLQGTSATFLYELGLDKITFANLTKMYGTFWLILGTFLGGIVIELLGVHAAAFLSIVLQILSCLVFALQAHIGYDPIVLSFSIGLENFSSGVMLSALIAMISFYVQKPYTMSHYTLLYAIGSLSRVFFSSFSGFFAEKMGWIMLYLSVAWIILPTTYLILKLKSLSLKKED